MIYHTDKHFYALEMGYRFAGPGLYPLHERISGFNTYKWMIEISLGENHSREDLPEPLETAFTECSGSYDLFASCSGTINTIVGLNEIQSLPNVILDMPKREGDTVRKHTNFGIIKIHGRDCDEMCNTISYINSHLKILNSAGTNMFIIFDNFQIVKNEYQSGLAEFKHNTIAS